MIEDSRMTDFIFSERDNDRNVKNDSLKNFREVINFVNIFSYIISQALSNSVIPIFTNLILRKVNKVFFGEVNNSKVKIYFIVRKRK